MNYLKHLLYEKVKTTANINFYFHITANKNISRNLILFITVMGYSNFIFKILNL